MGEERCWREKLYRGGDEGRKGGDIRGRNQVEEGMREQTGKL